MSVEGQGCCDEVWSSSVGGLQHRVSEQLHALAVLLLALFFIGGLVNIKSFLDTLW
jgi:hypothetical protein